MKTIWLGALALTPLVACYGGERRNSGECPEGETCSDLTPAGLDFIGNHLVNDILLSGPRATAIGGTQIVALEYDRGDGIDVALDIPYIADDDGGIGVRVESTSGSQVTLRGAGSRSNYLRILDSDGLLMDRKELKAAALSRMELVSADFETVPADTLIAFAPGERELGIALYGEGERLVDTSMELVLAGAQRLAWDTLRIDAAVGTYALDVTAGDKPTNTLDVVVVDHADTVALMTGAPSSIMPNSSQSVCFVAKSAGRAIVGLTWTFIVDGMTKVQGDSHLNRNCVSVSTTKTTGTVSIEASAGGQSTAMALSVGTAPREVIDLAPRTQKLPEAIPTAGDRAAM